MLCAVIGRPLPPPLYTQIDAPRDMLVPIRVGTSGDLRVSRGVSGNAGLT